MKRKILLIAMSCSVLFTLAACNNKNIEDKKEKVTYENLTGEMDESVSPEYRNQLSIDLGGQMLDFKAKTFSGENIDESIFKDSDITIVNVWGTEENKSDLKELQKLYSEVKDKDVNVLGVLSSEEKSEEAKKLADSNEVEFTNIIPDESLKDNLLSRVTAVPTTFFVNSKGEIVGDSILGPVSVENYKKALDVAIEHNKSK